MFILSNFLNQIKLRTFIRKIMKYKKALRVMIKISNLSVFNIYSVFENYNKFISSIDTVKKMKDGI